MSLQSIHPNAWVAPSAQLYGKITIGEGSSVWHNAVMRAECHEIRIGRVTNIQDFVMIHVAYEGGTVVGDFCSIAHHTTLHGCTIEDQTLVGIGATIMDGAVIGRGSIVAGGAFVKEGTIVPPGSIVAGVPAKVIRQRDSARENRLNAWQYHRNAAHYRSGMHRAWDGDEYLAWLQEIQAAIASDADLARSLD
jgi:carbonic anhydrase/acetyltransferase-like protein (isoleucine patch superfamily)